MDTGNDLSTCGGKGGGSCKWVSTDPLLGCVDGDPSTCSEFNLLEAEESDFHDQHLAAATAAIKEILANIPPDEKGRSLSLLKTSMGQLLAWVEHGAEHRTGGVTAEDDDDKVVAALKLKV